jgi:hypothetical protein
MTLAWTTTQPFSIGPGIIGPDGATRLSAHAGVERKFPSHWDELISRKSCMSLSVPPRKTINGNRLAADLTNLQASRNDSADIEVGSTTMGSNSGNKKHLLNLLDQTPRNAATSTKLTADILSVVKTMEQVDCPTPEAEVLQQLSGNWELLWTAQDTESEQYKSNPIRRWIK